LAEERERTSETTETDRIFRISVVNESAAAANNTEEARKITNARLAQEVNRQRKLFVRVFVANG